MENITLKKFSKESDIENSRKIKSMEWEKLTKRPDLVKAQGEQPLPGQKSLYEIIQGYAEEDDRMYEEAKRYKNQINVVTDEESAFLNSLVEKQQKRARDIEAENAQAILEYRRELKRAAFNQTFRPNDATPIPFSNTNIDHSSTNSSKSNDGIKFKDFSKYNNTSSNQTKTFTSQKQSQSNHLKHLVKSCVVIKPKPLGNEIKINLPAKQSNNSFTAQTCVTPSVLSLQAYEDSSSHSSEDNNSNNDFEKEIDLKKLKSEDKNVFENSPEATFEHQKINKLDNTRSPSITSTSSYISSNSVGSPFSPPRIEESQNLEIELNKTQLPDRQQTTPDWKAQLNAQFSDSHTSSDEE